MQFAVVFGSFFQSSAQEIITVTQEEIQATPLFQMQDVPKTFATLLGDSQADVILRKWNTDLKLRGVRLLSYRRTNQIPSYLSCFKKQHSL